MTDTRDRYGTPTDGKLPEPAAVREEMAKDGWQIAEPVIAAVLRAVERLRAAGQ